VDRVRIRFEAWPWLLCSWVLTDPDADLRPAVLAEGGAAAEAGSRNIELVVGLTASTAEAGVRLERDETVGRLAMKAGELGRGEVDLLAGGVVGRLDALREGGSLAGDAGPRFQNGAREGVGLGPPRDVDDVARAAEREHVADERDGVDLVPREALDSL